LRVEVLEGRHMLSGYTITDIGPIAEEVQYSIIISGQRAGLNNAAQVQVVGEAANGHAYIWDAVHGMQDLGAFGKDNQSHGFSVNDTGQVVGESFHTKPAVTKEGVSYDVLTSENPFLWDSTHGMQNLVKGDWAAGINAYGEVAGQTRGGAAVWWEGTWTPIGSLGGSSCAFGINAFGQVVGSSSFSTESTRTDAFIWTPSLAHGTQGKMIDLGPGEADAVNSGGTTVGNNGTQAFVWSPDGPNPTTGRRADLPIFDGVYPYSLVYSINGSGVAVGVANTPGGVHAVIWQPDASGNYTTISDLNALIPAGTGWVLEEADGINDRGQIVVRATNGGGVIDHALLLTPAVTVASTATATVVPAPAQPGAGLVASPADVAIMPGVTAGPVFDVALEQLMTGPQHRKHPALF
jgi:probable HAF family extracellular repeat protein